jgi:hypothetical protein
MTWYDMDWHAPQVTEKFEKASSWRQEPYERDSHSTRTAHRCIKSHLTRPIYVNPTWSKTDVKISPQRVPLVNRRGRRALALASR